MIMINEEDDVEDEESDEEYRDDVVLEEIGYPGGGTLFYGLHRYVRPHRVWFSAVLVINGVSILADFSPFRS